MGNLGGSHDKNAFGCRTENDFGEAVAHWDAWRSTDRGPWGTHCLAGSEQPSRDHNPASKSVGEHL